MNLTPWRIGATLLLLVSCGLPAVGCVDIAATDTHYVERDEKRFRVSGTPDLTLNTFDGSIVVKTWDRPEVYVVAEKRGFDHDALDTIRIDTDQQDNVINVRARTDSSRTVVFGFGRSLSVRFIVTVPIQTKLRASTGDGRIDINDVNGEMAADTGDGSITLQDVVGDVDVQSGDGRIRVDGKVTRVHARSGDGSIGVHAYPGSEARDDWSITTGDGSIVLEVPDGIRADLEANTSDGRIVTRDLPGSSRSWDDEQPRERRRRSFRTALNGGGPRIRLRSGDGSITVRGS